MSLVRMSDPPPATPRRLAALLLSAVLSTMLVACGDDDSPSAGTPTQPGAPGQPPDATPQMRCAR